jgi:hypothetical protein
MEFAHKLYIKRFEMPTTEMAVAPNFPTIIKISKPVTVMDEKMQSMV